MTRTYHFWNNAKYHSVFKVSGKLPFNQITLNLRIFLLSSRLLRMVNKCCQGNKDFNNERFELDLMFLYSMDTKQIFYLNLMQTSCRGNFLGKNINKIKLYMIHLICLLYYKSGQFKIQNILSIILAGEKLFLWKPVNIYYRDT